MSVARYYEIVCDTEGRDCDDDGFMDPYLTVVRQHKRKQGWLCDASGDWCPKHRPDRQEDSQSTGGEA